ncbi:MerR family transcriptional regulator [Streptomyces ossamyceticus]|uniref:MerR family transcriptional regulator n=1 Tax=Streptomyces ossamyceticus TaxID=249581 RepID=A0ABV2V4Y1_9ACTN
MTLTEIDPQDLVTATEAALLMGVTARAVRFWTSKGLLVPVDLGDKGPRLYRIQDVTKAELASKRRLATRSRSQSAA